MNKTIALFPAARLPLTFVAMLHILENVEQGF